MNADLTLEEKTGIAWHWWRDLNPPDDSKKPGDRAALAMLRRAVEPRQIWLVEL